jgi:NADH-quinone oxidoreductase subunit E
MAVRRLSPDQPRDFAFTPENLAWAKETIAKFPEGKQASALIPLLWRAQEQAGGWLSEPALRHVADMLGVAHIRAYEVATFYTMFQLSPVGAKAHEQVCGTTPCMLRGAEALIDVCKRHIAEHPHELSEDGQLSWEEVECLGCCANAPVVQIFKDTYEDLTPEALEKILAAIERGATPKAGSQIGRTTSSPEGALTTLTDPALHDGSRLGAWRARFPELADGGAAAPPAEKPKG